MVERLQPNKRPFALREKGKKVTLKAYLKELKKAGVKGGAE